MPLNPESTIHYPLNTKLQVSTYALYATASIEEPIQQGPEPTPDV